jgi:hypothetical protein
MMKVLVSPMNIEEAKESIFGGADIIDVKNPAEGSLGANFPWIIQNIVKISKRYGKEVSATIGDMEYKPGTASLAALGAAVAGADYIKVGLYGIKNGGEAYRMLAAIVKTVKDFDNGKRIVAAAYADHRKIGSISPCSLPRIGEKAAVDGIMIDTAVKDGTTLFNHMKVSEIENFVQESHSRGLFCALAGSIKWEHLKLLKKIHPDIIGVRTIVCRNGRNSKIERELVEKLVTEVR